MDKVKEYFKNKNPNQIFSLCLFVTCIIVMVICVIARLFGILWFNADVSSIKIPSIFWQNRIMNLLFIIELVFVYKILCRIKWLYCLIISIVQTIIIHFINSETIANILNIIFIVIIPVVTTKSLFTIFDSICLYILMFLYSIIFLYGRIGSIELNSSYNFIYSIIGSIDYKLFIISIYLFVQSFGGVKLWKSQKRLIFQKDLLTKTK
jgi:hypothetical protein